MLGGFFQQPARLAHRLAQDVPPAALSQGQGCAGSGLRGSMSFSHEARLPSPNEPMPGSGSVYLGSGQFAWLGGGVRVASTSKLTPRPRAGVLTKPFRNSKLHLRATMLLKIKGNLMEATMSLKTIRVKPQTLCICAS